MKKYRINKKAIDFLKTPKCVDKIISLRQEGKSIIYISKKFNVSISPIRRIFKIKGIPTKEKEGKSSLRMQKYKINENYFNEINSQDKAYILGLLYADGSINKSSNCISLSLKDREILLKIKKAFNYTKPLFKRKKYSKNHSQQYQLDITNMQIYNDMVKHGLVPNKSLILTYPKNINPIYNRHFIRGYFDGDGCIYISKRIKEFSIVGTFSFLQSVSDIIKYDLSVELRVEKSNNVFRLRAGAKNNIRKIFDYFYFDSNMFLKRKYNKFKTI